MGRRYEIGKHLAELITLHLEDHYARAIEIGNARLLRSFRLRNLEMELAQQSPGLYVHDLDKIRADDAAGSSEWLPVEQVRATLRCGWVPEGCDPAGSSSLEVVWFQDVKEDPFFRLAEILLPLNWETLAVYEPNED